MPPEEKKKYEEMSELDKQRHEKEMNDYKASPKIAVVSKGIRK